MEENKKETALEEQLDKNNFLDLKKRIEKLEEKVLSKEEAEKIAAYIISKIIS